MRNATSVAKKTTSDSSANVVAAKVRRAERRAGGTAAGPSPGPGDRGRAHRRPASTPTSAATVTDPVASTPPVSRPPASASVDGGGHRLVQALHDVHPVLAEHLLGDLGEVLRRFQRAGGRRAGARRPRRARAPAREHAATSLSAITPTTPTSRLNVKASATASTSTAAPAGLCAASTRIEGLRRTTSSRPGEVTSAKAPRTRRPPAGRAAAEQRLDGGERDHRVVRLVRAVQREEHVVVGAGAAAQRPPAARRRPASRRSTPKSRPSRTSVRSPRGAGQQHRGGLLLLLGEDDERAVLEDPGLLGGDLRDRRARATRSWSSDTGVTTATSGRDDVGGVPRAAQPHLDDGDVHRGVGEGREGHGGEHLEEPQPRAARRPASARRPERRTGATSSQARTKARVGQAARRRWRSAR